MGAGTAVALALIMAGGDESPARAQAEGGPVEDRPVAGADGDESEKGDGHKAETAEKTEAPPPINWFTWHYGKDVEGGTLDPGEEPMPPGLLFALINFAVFATLLVKFAGPKLATYLRVHHETVKGQLDEAARLRAEARDKLDEYNRRIEGMDQEVTRLMHEIRGEAEAERDAMLAQARIQAEALGREAQLRIESEIARARLELEREVVAAAVAAAEKLLRQRTTPDDQARLFDGFISSLAAGGGRTPRGTDEERGS